MLAALAALLATEARAQTGTTPIGIEQGDYLCVRTPHIGGVIDLRTARATLARGAGRGMVWGTRRGFGGRRRG